MSEEFEKLELNTLNVLRLMKECRKTDATVNVKSGNFYADALHDKAPILDFDKEKLLERKESIRYLLGQLHAVHSRETQRASRPVLGEFALNRSVKLMTFADGAVNYKGEKWTDDKVALWALYYLGTASLTMSPFDVYKLESTGKMGVFCDIAVFKNLNPTFWPPKDE